MVKFAIIVSKNLGEQLLKRQNGKQMIERNMVIDDYKVDLQLMSKTACCFFYRFLCFFGISNHGSFYKMMPVQNAPRKVIKKLYYSQLCTSCQIKVPND